MNINNIDITNHLNDIADINQNIQTFARRALDLRSQMVHENFITNQIFTIKNIRYTIFSSLCFVFSLSILLLLFSYLHYLISSVPIEKLTFAYLESEEMYVTLIMTFICFFILTWNIYLFISLIICQNDFSDLQSTAQKPNEILTADLIYFNPVIFCFLVQIFNKDFFKTGFDIFSWALFSSKFFLNFGFTCKLYVYANLKINSITNTMLPENNQMMRRIRLNYFFLIVMNIGFTYLLKEFLEETNFMFKYFLIFKGVYLFCKQIEFLVILEMNYKFLHSGTTIKEENFMMHLSIKSKFQIINMLLILHKLIFSIFVILYTGQGFYFFIPLMIIIINLWYNIFNNYTSYTRVKNFYHKLDIQFPNVKPEKEEECIICTENLVNARKLACNHHFHLICISKWIEKGNKNCPICRKEIDLHTNQQAVERSPWTYGIRLDGRFFSWLPNITLRIVRMNSPNDNNSS